MFPFPPRHLRLWMRILPNGAPSPHGRKYPRPQFVGQLETIPEEEWLAAALVRERPPPALIRQSADVLMSACEFGTASKDRDDARVGRGGRWLLSDRRRRAALPRRFGRGRRLEPRPLAARRDRRDPAAGRRGSRMRIRRSSRTSRPSASPRSSSRSRRRASAPGRVAFVGSGSEAMEVALKLVRQYFVERGELRAHALHRAAHELSRQHARRAGRRRPLPATRDVRADADAGVARRALLRVSLPRPPAKSDAAYGQRVADELDAEIRRRRPGARRGVRRRACRRRDARMRAAVDRLFRAHPRDLRPPRRALHRRRGDVRHGAHRHAVRACARRRVPRHRSRSARGSAPATCRSARRWRASASSRRCARAPARSPTGTPT